MKLQKLEQYTFNKMYEESFQKKATFFLKGYDLTGIVGQKLDLQLFIVRNSMVKNCHFSKCDFSGCMMFDNTYINNTFSECEFRKSEIMSSTAEQDNVFENCDMYRSFLNKLNFQNSKFLHCNFRAVYALECNLLGCDFSSCNLYGCTLQDTDIRYANLEGVNFDQAQFIGAKMYNDKKFHFSNINTRNQKKVDFSKNGDGSYILTKDVLSILVSSQIP